MTTVRRLPILLATTATLAAGLAACGSSSSSDTLSRKEIVSKATTICQAATTKGKAIKAPANIQDAGAAAAYFDKVEPIVDAATAKLAALKPDSGVAADWNAYMKVRRQSGDLLKTIRQKADAKDASGLKDLQSASAVGAKEASAAKKLGAPACA